jgi:hypothetical protein
MRGRDVARILSGLALFLLSWAYGNPDIGLAFVAGILFSWGLEPPEEGAEASAA